MNVGRMILGGLVGGLVGAAIWVAIGYFTGYEVGWIAWGVGFLAGMGVRLVGTEQVGRYDRDLGRMVHEKQRAEGPEAGIIAAIAAVLSVIIGKYAVVYLLLSSFTSVDFSDQELLISYVADQVADEYVEKGRAVQWPAGVDPTDAYQKSDYPLDVWTEATNRWNAMSSEEQQEFQEMQELVFNTAVDSMGGEMRQAAFWESFSPLDLLWFGLAALTAFRVGSGHTGEA